MPRHKRLIMMAVLFILALAIFAAVIMFTTRDGVSIGELTANTPVTQAQSLVASRIRPGMDITTARKTAVELGFEMAPEPDHAGVMRGIIRGTASGLNPVSRSLRVEIILNQDQIVDRVECNDIFTGP